MLSNKWLGYSYRWLIADLNGDIMSTYNGYDKDEVSRDFDFKLRIEVHKSELIRSLLETKQEE